MSHQADSTRDEQLTQINEFVAKSSGLQAKLQSEALVIHQRTDGKAISVPLTELDEVIARIDSDGHAFLQVNFRSGKKILLTQNLIGFKPAPSRGLDLAKLPKVVTTPDLISVVEAIEDSLSTQPSQPEELDVLKRVFESVLRGAEAVGFDITSERMWMQGLSRNSQPSA